MNFIKSIYEWVKAKRNFINIVIITLIFSLFAGIFFRIDGLGLFSIMVGILFLLCMIYGNPYNQNEPNDNDDPGLSEESNIERNIQNFINKFLKGNYIQLLLPFFIKIILLFKGNVKELTSEGIERLKTEMKGLNEELDKAAAEQQKTYTPSKPKPKPQG